MGRKVKEGSRVSRRALTKSAKRLDCQRKTRGAANRAAKELVGKPREGGYNQRRAFDRWVNSNPDHSPNSPMADEPLADWERAALRNSAVISMVP